MTSFFKNKKKEISSGTIKGIQHLDGQYKKFDESIAPDDVAPSKGDDFTVVNKGHFVTFSVSEKDSCSPDLEMPHSAASANTQHSENVLHHQQTESMSEKINLTSQTSSFTKCNSADEFEVIRCKHCKTKLTDEQQMSKSVSTQCESDGEQNQDNWVRTDRGKVEHTEAAVLQEIDSLFGTIQICYKEFTGKDSAIQSNTKFYDDIHDNIKEALMQIYEIKEYAAKTKKRNVKEKKKEKEDRGIGKQENMQDIADGGTASDMTIKFEQQKKEITDATLQMHGLMSTLQEHTKRHRELEQNIAKLENEKESLLTRLSTIAGSRLRDGNPSITDLSDDNRPISIAEKFSELYDNEWTDAFERLKGDRNEEETIKLLLDILRETYTTCGIISEHQAQRLQQFGVDIEEDEGDVAKLNTEQERKVKEVQLMIGGAAVARVQRKILSDNEFKMKYNDYFKDCEIYMRACIQICWMMNMQEVPMFLDFTCWRESPVNRNSYKEYTKSGKSCDYLVWPLLLLHIDGPVMQKGILQPL